ncbi:hypothetical protein C0992_007464 [Termitomyces sp. T32_za158]|nr:hypothetical protein C0992_007464 [Termitomyces sp. T32_za158]
MSSGKEPKSKKLRLETSESIPSSPTDPPPQPRRVVSREVNWITLDEGKLHGQHLSDRAPANFYVKYLVEDRGSLAGRCTRVWCVYQEVFESDPLLDRYQNKLSKGKRVMKGPYALKIYNADMFTEAYEQDILVKAMNIHQSTPLDGVLLPTHVWHLGDILFLVRGLTQDERPPKIPLDKMKNRQEVFTISAFKRTLSQFETVEEFYHVLIGVLRGIESLQAINIIHRDISFGNIIIDKEIYCGTDKEFELIDVDGQDGPVALVRRETVDIGARGGLHDLDMAAYIPKAVFVQKLGIPSLDVPPQEVAPTELVSPVQQNPQRDWRTGTVPFMSIPVLIGGQHSVTDDLHSLFFVLYLSFFTFDERLPNCFPNAPPPLRYRWPEAFLEWMGPDRKLSTLGSSKTNFFSNNGNWYDALNSNALSLWRTSNDKAFKWVYWSMLGTFYKQLWFLRNDAPIRIGVSLEEQKEVTPLSIRTALQTKLENLDMNSDIALVDRVKSIKA